MRGGVITLNRGYYTAGIPFSRHNSLAHYGRKGQKWGVRRFQNPDGSLAPEGRLRYLGDNYKDSRKRIHDAWNRRETDGENYNRYILGDDTPADLARKSDDWKFLRDSKINMERRLQPDIDKVRELQKKSQSLNPFGSKKTLQRMARGHERATRKRTS